MHRLYRPPTVSKASPSTLCQKCLKRGHYSFECKASTQERPYAARPSRTQQLLNPKLAPKLTTEVPDDLIRKPTALDNKPAHKSDDRGRKRSPSPASSRSSSVSTISTVATRSQSPPKSRYEARDKRSSKGGPESRRSRHGKKRARSESRSPGRDLDDSELDERNIRRRLSSFSPAPRGRRHSRARDGDRRTRSRSTGRNRRISRSPGGAGSWKGRQSRSRSPYANDRQMSDRPPQFERPPPQDFAMEQRAPSPPRQRSLSPYSKRIALTRNMGGMGR
ncbi:hypothetical protein EJ06DRAFT_531461 [Trichodelitschia bisporula]|uniref:Zinc knuckle-domain-containing protein n=1 Tax=Trichodelitschia bisporula TaxID=703511 RepID=A0A6G1HSZ1_9PEZI|nr:hypothetical protein EJ06DRAFT_531461 [Trichodelitschia bisporula]